MNPVKSSSTRPCGRSSRPTRLTSSMSESQSMEMNFTRSALPEMRAILLLIKIVLILSYQNGRLAGTEATLALM